MTDDIEEMSQRLAPKNGDKAIWPQDTPSATSALGLTLPGVSAHMCQASRGGACHVEQHVPGRAIAAHVQDRADAAPAVGPQRRQRVLGRPRHAGTALAVGWTAEALPLPHRRGNDVGCEDRHDRHGGRRRNRLRSPVTALVTTREEASNDGADGAARNLSAVARVPLQEGAVRRLCAPDPMRSYVLFTASSIVHRRRGQSEDSWLSSGREVPERRRTFPVARRIRLLPPAIPYTPAS